MVTGAATDAIKVVIREGMTVVFLFGYLLWMNWRLTLVMVAILPIIGVMVASASRKFRKQSRKIQVAMGDLTHVASETIQGYRVVRSFGGEDYESARFRAASEDNTAKQLRMVRTAATYTPALQFVTFSAPWPRCWCWSCCCAATPRPATWSPTSPPPACCRSRSGSFPKSAPPSRRGWRAPRASSPNSTRRRNPITGPSKGSGSRAGWKSAISPSPIPAVAQRVLDQVSFSVEPGQMVALVGRSGSGKSTLANLIPRFYHHDSGQILIDGVDVEDYTLRNLRQAHRAGHPAGGAVQRHIAGNIAYGDLASAPRAASRRPPRRPLPASSSTACRPASTRWSAKTA
jgi:subfamily B ATP-binding cassette protein MsbA